MGYTGAGKSTIIIVLSGAHRADAGTMELGGRPYHPVDPHDARLKGVATIYQELNLARHLSVQENILLGAESARFGVIARAESRERARAVLGELGHGGLALDRPAGEFPIALQQIIEIARALLLQPLVLLMDEPTSSLGAADTARLFDTIGRLKRQGVSIIYISHVLEECRQVADRFTVLKDGHTVGTGAMHTATIDQLVKLMTGREVRELYPETIRTPGPVVLEAQAVAAPPRLKQASLELRAGEIVGIAGLVGAGRTDLLRVIFGLDRLEAGEVAVVGSRPGVPTPRARWSQGVGFLSENRKEEGLMLGQSIADNLTLTKLPAFGWAGLVRRPRQRAAAERWIRKLGVKCRDADQPVMELSGGSQQKIAIARLLEHPARIFLLDEPTRGIDVGSKAEIYEIVGKLAAAGNTVVFASSSLPELLGLADRIGVMCRGELAAMRPRAAWDEAEIMRVATGSAV
jgi:ribose transport system ATP-binding protein